MKKVNWGILRRIVLAVGRAVGGAVGAQAMTR